MVYQLYLKKWVCMSKMLWYLAHDVKNVSYYDGFRLVEIDIEMGCLKKVFTLFC